MDRNASPEEERNRKIAELTEQLFQARLAKLGQPAVLRDVTDSVFNHLANLRHVDETYKLAAGELTFLQVRDQVMRDEAEVDAIKAVERIEQNREEDARRARIERRIWDRELA